MKKIISMLFATILVLGFTSSANAAKTLGIDALIFLPKTVSEAKLKKIQSFGAEVQLVGDDSGDAEVEARDYAENKNLRYLSP